MTSRPKKLFLYSDGKVGVISKFKGRIEKQSLKIYHLPRDTQTETLLLYMDNGDIVTEDYIIDTNETYIGKKVVISSPGIKELSGTIEKFNKDVVMIKDKYKKKTVIFRGNKLLAITFDKTIPDEIIIEIPFYKIIPENIYYIRRSGIRWALTYNVMLNEREDKFDSIIATWNITNTSNIDEKSVDVTIVTGKLASVREARMMQYSERSYSQSSVPVPTELETQISSKTLLDIPGHKITRSLFFIGDADVTKRFYYKFDNHTRTKEMDNILIEFNWKVKDKLLGNALWESDNVLPQGIISLYSYDLLLKGEFNIPYTPVGEVIHIRGVPDQKIKITSSIQREYRKTQERTKTKYTGNAKIYNFHSYTTIINLEFDISDSEIKILEVEGIDDYFFLKERNVMVFVVTVKSQYEKEVVFSIVEI